MRKFVYALIGLLTLGCNGSGTPTGNEGEGESEGECSSYRCDSGNRDPRGNGNGNCNSCNDSLDGKVDGSDMGENKDRDGDLDGRLDGGSDATDGPRDDMTVTYPRAVLACTPPEGSVGADGVCELTLRKRRTYTWNASGSEAGSERSLVDYRAYLGVPDFPDFYVGSTTPSISGGYTVTSAEYGLDDGFPGFLRVTDDLGDSDDKPFRAIVTE